ncbi:D-serine deaminase, pyridoxal phosphate-dependent [Nakamurella panacisegetis]|uniref:D-serine deaminase, pyridoxal phosphate-dependent n=1 Tax=Nakamurella panacisegetis TaxID=1090615 RepID=A0A1H0K477_9ACTN|nr:amino acid deaminase/aldolase [Nakamurella panacisegetis]SDO50815.1 D-serine deaminase, pyridoxal phosphate-dependent [Nakamurella panacisegetis]
MTIRAGAAIPGIADLRAATADLDPPFGVLDRAALDWNADDLRRRAAGKPIRIASKSIRIRQVLADTLARPGFAGLLCYTLPEALWLYGKDFRDLVVGYPSVHRAGIAQLAADEGAAAAVTLMIDDAAQLDLIDAVLPPARRNVIRVCIELDAGFRKGPIKAGALRSPVRTPDAAQALARLIAARPGFRLVGMMAYEGQIAGVGNAGRGLRPRLVRAMQHRSAAELLERRALVVAAVRGVADLEFVNGGGTGSLETTTAEDAVTELAAGSGLVGPGLFDHYGAFHPHPAMYFVMSVVRRPSRSVATMLGGGWVASGPVGADRLPVIADPPGLEYVDLEGAGEVQTPLRGRRARNLAVGEQIWLRHAKAGEPAEHLNEFHLVEDGRITDVLPTYRGEGQVFL